MALSRDDILGADDLPLKEIEVPEWGGTVWVRGMTGTERDRFEWRISQTQNKPENIQVRSEFVGRCLVDEDGKRLFTDKDAAKLGEKSGAVLDRLFDEVRAMSGMGEDEVEDAAEDFGETPSDDSPSD